MLIHGGESQLCVVILDHAVAAGWDVFGVKRDDPVAVRVNCKLEQDCFFNPTLQYAATHEPGVYHPSLVLSTADDDTDHAVVAELVRKADLQCKDVGVALQRGDLGLRVSSR